MMFLKRFLTLSGSALLLVLSIPLPPVFAEDGEGLAGEVGEIEVSYFVQDAGFAFNCDPGLHEDSPPPYLAAWTGEVRIVRNAKGQGFDAIECTKLVPEPLNIENVRQQKSLERVNQGTEDCVTYSLGERAHDMASAVRLAVDELRSKPGCGEARLERKPQPRKRRQG